jgi:diguanylate cyclase (GGDEF)-like protein
MAHLIVVEGPNQGKTYQVSKRETIGTEKKCSIILGDRRVAKVHAEIRKRKSGTCEIRNLEPRKNILVNGEVIKNVMLQHGDWITIADTTLVFSEDADPEERPSLELDSIDPGELLTSNIHSRRKQFEDADSVIESIDHAGNADSRLRTLYKVTHELCQIMDLRQLVDRLATLTLELFDADRTFVLIMDDETNRLKPMASKQRSAGSESAEFSRTIIKAVFRNKEAVLCSDAQDDARFLSGQSIVDQNLRSFMCVPFMHQNNVTGMIQVNSSSDNEPFDADDLELICAVGMQVGVLIENCKAYRKRQEYNQILFHLGRATQQLSSLLQRDRILKEAVRIACKLLNCTKASVMLVTANDNLRLASVQGMTPDVWSKIDKKTLGKRFVRNVIEEGKPLLVSNIRELGYKLNPRYQSNSLLIVPILSSVLDGEKPIGAVSVTDKVGGGKFSGNDQKILSILAGQVAITIKNADLYEKATVDSLTKVYVRRFFDLKLEEEMLTARDKKCALSLLMLDIDHFKKVNDNYSHIAGDAVLKNFAALLKKCVRPSDCVARYGGEEFAIILTKADETRACRVAERVRQAVESSEFKVPNETLKITCSIGIATYEQGEKALAFLKRSDEAMYEAKTGGRNQYRLYSKKKD